MQLKVIKGKCKHQCHVNANIKTYISLPNCPVHEDFWFIIMLSYFFSDLIIYNDVVRSYVMYIVFYNSSVTFYKTMFVVTMINIQ